MKDRTVQAGDQVQTGQLVGHMGNTGHSYGQHLILNCTMENGILKNKCSKPTAIFS